MDRGGGRGGGRGGNPWGNPRGGGRGSVPPTAGRGAPSGRGNNGGGGEPSRPSPVDPPRLAGDGGEPGPSRGEGGGRGAGSGGLRGARRNKRIEKHDCVVSKPDELKKQGSTGMKVNLVSNYFPLVKKTDWCIFKYHVDFLPEVEMSKDKKRLMRPHRATLGPHIFDGSSLYVSNKLNPDPMDLFSFADEEIRTDKVKISIKLTGPLDPTDWMYIQFYNIVVRKAMELMGLEEFGRHYYDPRATIRMEAQRLELWPGFKTSMRHHENETLLCVDVTHKVIRLDNVLSVIKNLRYHQQNVENELIGCIVMTPHNRKNYKIDHINWEETPRSVFEMGREKRRVSYAEYYETKYSLKIKEMNQPILISRPKKKDFHRGFTSNISLIPELCNMTGLSDAMRANHQLTSALATHLNVVPANRVNSIDRFMNKLLSTQAIQDDMKLWGIKFSNKLVQLSGRELPSEDIVFGNNKKDKPERGDDFSNLCKKFPMLAVVPLTKWVIIVPQRISQAADRLLATIGDVQRGLGMSVRTLSSNEIVKIPQDFARHYEEAIQRIVAQHGTSLQLIVAILPNNNTDTYAVVKRKCCLDYGVPSQCLLARNTENPSKFKSICTKLMIQVNAKLSGQPWTISVPLRNLMVIGFDVYHCGKRKGPSVGAMVASTNKELTKYFSTTSRHTDRMELADSLHVDMTKCLQTYFELNGHLPERIIMYRDGVGEGQLTFVWDTELKQITNAISDVYKEATKPKFTFIVVTKRINTRLFLKNSNPNGPLLNPRPGTVVDDVITLPERFDFFLVPQSVRLGTASPTSYNVLVDAQGLPPDKLQLITYRLCHMYFNWSGTVAVPAPCQYAHKLAYLTGIALDGRQVTSRLSHSLYYL